MISKKMLALGTKRSCIREIFEYSKQRKAQIGEEKVFDFSLGNPSIPAPKKVEKTLKKLINKCDSVKLHGYTSAAGDMAVKEKICKNILNRFGFFADPSLVYMTCGAAASLTITLKAVATRGDEVILLAPFFPEYRVFVENCGAAVKVVKCAEKTFEIDIEKIENAITEKTAAIIINSPNNPTGVVFSEESIKSLSELLYRKNEEFGKSITIIADEPYRELTYDNCVAPYIPNYYDNTVVCYSYSKSLSLPGERIGYIMISPKMQSAQEVFAAVCGAGRSMGFVCAPSMWQRVAAKCDGTKPEIWAYDKNRTLLYDSLIKIGFEAVKPQGAFYLFLKSPMHDAQEFCEKAKKYELLLVPSDDFGVKGYVRIAYCVSYEQIKRSLPAFQKLYEEIKNDRA